MNDFSACPVVDRFLAEIRGGSVATSTDVYAPDVQLDATVPGWRFAVRGEEAVRSEYARWFTHEATLEEVTRHSTVSGEVIEYTMAWVEDGVPHAARHVHLLTVDRRHDRITGDHVWCGGRWPAPLLAEMGADAVG